MIEINLLPPEMRKVDRTSLKRLLCMVTVVVLVSASLLAVALSFKRYRAEGARKVSLQSEVARLEPLAREYDVLSAEIQQIQMRLQTIAEIRATRLRWGRKLDQLYAILPDYVWFSRIDLRQARGRSPLASGPTATLTLECYVAGADEKKYSEFRRILTGEVVADGAYTGEDFFSEFQSLGYSGWSREDFPATEEGVALKFDLELPLKPMAAPAPVSTPARPVVATQ